MIQANETDSDKNKTAKKKKGRSRSWWLWRVGLIFVGVGLVVGSYYFKNAAERVKFLTESMLSVGILIVIIIQARIYSVQKKIMGIQARVMIKQGETMNASVIETRKLVAQNERAVEAAEDNVKTVEKTAVYANRAYVAVKLNEIKEGFQFSFSIENSGNTPANNVCVIYSYGLLDKPPVEKVEGQIVYDAGYTQIERLGLIAPRSSAPLTTPRQPQLTGPEHQKWKLNQIRFYCWGQIGYEDMFNETRVTWFCFYQSQGHPRGYPNEYGNQAI